MSEQNAEKLGLNARPGVDKLVNFFTNNRRLLIIVGGILLILFFLFLLWKIFAGMRDAGNAHIAASKDSPPPIASDKVPPQPAVLPDPSLPLIQLRRYNDDLEQRIAAAKLDLANFKCVVEPVNSTTDRKVVPNSSDQAAVQPEVSKDASKTPDNSSLNPSPGQVAKDATAPQQPPPAPATGEARRLSRSEVVDWLEHSTVMVLTKSGSGSGFFLSPNTILTNSHVVNGSVTSPILVMSKALKTIKRVQIGAITRPKKPGDIDFALLTLAEPIVDARPLHLAGNAEKLQNTIAAGYPGLIVSSDAEFQSLLTGKVGAAPELVLSYGQISTLQEQSNGLTTVIHTASIMSGNSGGPLVDACGRVLGINTFIAFDAANASRAGYAISSNDISSFLNSNGLNLQKDLRPCPDAE